MINPETYPPLDPSIVPEVVRLGNGVPMEVVTIHDAARIVAMKKRTIEDWITEGKISICRTPDGARRVFVHGLWLNLPIELRR